MVDLIPIGTINRTTTENNSIKTAKDVQQSSGTKALDDTRVPGGLERRRTVDRRRRSAGSAEPGARARYKKEGIKLDRRGSPRTVVPEDRRKAKKKPSRKGRIIDERV